MLEEMVNYTQVADERIISVFNSTAVDMPEAEKLFSHVLNAQHIWVNRITGEKALYGVWDIQSKTSFVKMSADNFIQIRTILNDVPLNQMIIYSNSKGDQYQNKVEEVLFHLLNHSTYHRAQIATLFKKAGFTPPITDYIMLKRDHQL
ncbi:DinB family protein [Pedobacter nototheniae]|uniref:DinB family protein n=1 Tax=Pedobacter nototheniae TaxID=2488994 RepID=UPI00293170D8|nr:DinB family protein [Pedobacter nototheniae]